MELTKIMTFCNKRNIKFKDLINELGVIDADLSTPSKDWISSAKKSAMPVNATDKMAVLTNSITNMFKPIFDWITEYWETCDNGEKDLIQTSGMDFSMVMPQTIENVRLKLTTEKRQEFDEILQQCVSSSNARINYLCNLLDKKPLQSLKFIFSMPPSDIECWYNCGIISKDIQAFILGIGFNKTIDFGSEPFTQSFRTYILQNTNDYYLDL